MCIILAQRFKNVEQPRDIMESTKTPKKSANKEKTTPLLEQYFRIRAEYPEYLLFFHLGDFYELFFEDAIKASSVAGLALTHRGQYKGEDVPMCGVPVHAYDAYLAKLVRHGYKIALCEQTEDPKEAKKRGYKSVVNREVVRLITAGTLTDDPLLNAKSNNFLLSLHRQSSILGAAWIDISTGEFYTQDFDLNKEKELSLIAMLLTRLRPSEIVVADNYAYDAAIKDMLYTNCQQLSILPQDRFNTDNAKTHLQKVYKVKTLSAFGDFSAAELTAAGVLLDYVEASQKGGLPLLQGLVKVASGEVMEIDNATRRSLELTAPLTEGSDMTLLKSLDRTITSVGGRLLCSRLTNPLKNIAVIGERLDMIDFFVQCAEARKEVRSLLHNVCDIERALSRVMVGRSSPRDVVNIKNTLALIAKLRNQIHFKSNVPSLEVVVPQVLQKAMDKLGNYNNLICRIEEAFREDDLPNSARDGGFIRDGYSAELDNLHKLKSNGHVMILSLQSKYATATGIEHLKVKYNSVIGYFIEVPIKDAEKLLHNPEFIFRQSVLNASRYTTAELTELENKVRSAAEKSLALELELYEELLKYIKAVSEQIVKTAQAFAEIDVAAALADLAVEYDYCRPILDNSTDFEVIAGRHPVVEQALSKKSGEKFVANDCNLSGKDGHLWLLTGPNMAGKSTYLRQNAIIAIMAQMGSFVPAKSAKIGIIDKLFSRVGAADDLARGQSTFMVEMVETAAILNKADEHSFVILDEIGRGTATFDGLSIAWAVVEYLHEAIHCRTIFATHYHELTALDKKLSGISLHCMRVKDFNGEVVFLHEVASGSADRRYGIHVAQIAGIPVTVIRRANEVLHNLESQNKGLSAKEAAAQLPLFGYVKEHMSKESELEKKIRELNPDDYSPREALAQLYELKKLA